MKKVFLWLCLFCAGFSFAANSAAVTYDFSGGRFGDNVLAYLHAKWVSYTCQIPLIYKPFPYSSELMLDEGEIHYDQAPYKYNVQIPLKGDLSRIIQRLPCLYVCPYFPEVEWELKKERYYNFKVDWTDVGFREVVHKMLKPKKRLSLIKPPKNVLSVAIHVREGGGYDDEEHPLKDPLKSPPLSYYIQCLHKLFDLFLDTPLYCHVFTDAQEPAKLIEQMKAQVPLGMQISFHYREKGNHHDANVVEDFFSLMNFDILIRPESNYSIIPSLIHPYMLVYFPSTYSIHNKVVKIEEIKFSFDTDRLINALPKKCFQNI